VLEGPALFLAGHALFERTVFDVRSVPRLAAIPALAPAAIAVSPLVLASAATAVVAAVRGADVITYRGGAGAAQTKTRVRS
jgi:hypothetical protein